MDKTLRKDILLGFFVMLGIALFIFGTFQVGSKNEKMFSKTFIITARFANATGLKTGGVVRFNGVKAGIVKFVNLLNDSVVQVDMQIEEKQRQYITENAIASIASDGLMGDKIVNITTGKKGGAIIHDNALIASHTPLVTDQIMQTLNESNENIKAITGNLKVLTSDLNSKKGTIQMLYKDTQTAHNLRQSFLNLNALTGKVLKVSTDLQEITAGIQNGKGAIGELLNDSSFGENIASTLNNLKETSNELNTTSGQLSSVVQHANSGKGTVGLLLTDTALASSIQQSMVNIKNASAGLNENMEALKHSFLLKRYFKKKAKGK